MDLKAVALDLHPECEIATPAMAKLAEGLGLGPTTVWKIQREGRADPTYELAVVGLMVARGRLDLVGKHLPSYLHPSLQQLALL